MRPSRVISAERAAAWQRVAKLDWLTTDEAALYTRFSLRSFERFAAEGCIPFARPAGPRGVKRWHRADLDAHLMSRRETPAA